MNDGRSIARTRRWPGRIARACGYLVLGLLALSALGALIPAIPVFGSIGPLLIAPFGSWIVLLALAAAVPFALRWRRTRRRGAVVVAGLAGFVALGTAIVIVDQVAVARANGIPIALGRTLWAGAPGHSGAAPIVARYGAERGQPLNLLVYRPAPRPDGARAPIVVYVHGGGWSGGSITDRARDMRFLADRGYLVFSVGYTLSSETVHPWNLAEPQIGCALVRIAAQATRFGGDPTRLALLGESAGGNLVVNVAYKIAAGRFQPACAGPLPRIAAIIAPYPVLDAVRMYHNGDWIAGPFARLMTTRYTGSTPDHVPARYAAISSPRHIVAGAPPTLLLPGLADHLLPPVVAFDFERRAKAAGIPIRVIAVPHAEHSFDQAEGSVGSQIFRSASLQFLAQNGVVPHP